jgi:hypothetical protein
LKFLRLDDASQYCPPLEYFDNAVSRVDFSDGYISSDSINHEICRYLIDKYNLKIFKDDEVGTIQFASTCKHIVLSGGTFSWMIGLLSFFSKVTFPIQKIVWHGDIFVFDEWNGISY